MCWELNFGLPEQSTPLTAKPSLQLPGEGFILVSYLCVLVIYVLCLSMIICVHDMWVAYIMGDGIAGEDFKMLRACM